MLCLPAEIVQIENYSSAPELFDMPHRRKKGIYREVPAPEAQPFDAVWNVSIEANVLR